MSRETNETSQTEGPGPNLSGPGRKEAWRMGKGKGKNSGKSKGPIIGVQPEVAGEEGVPKGERNQKALSSPMGGPHAEKEGTGQEVHSG